MVVAWVCGSAEMTEPDWFRPTHLHPDEWTRRAAERQRELTEQYIAEKTFELNQVEVRLVARGLRRVRERYKRDLLQAKHDAPQRQNGHN